MIKKNEERVILKRQNNTKTITVFILLKLLGYILRLHKKSLLLKLI